jgi:flagellar biosynthesis regulator FlbT
MTKTCDNLNAAPGWREIKLRDGEQMIVNGALLAATASCKLRVGIGANLLRGKALRTGLGRSAPAHELYYATLEAASSDARLDDVRFRLLALLGVVVAQQRTHSAQQDCSRFAAALLAGEVEAMLEAARRLATRETEDFDREEKSAA